MEQEYPINTSRVTVTNLETGAVFDMPNVEILFNPIYPEPEFQDFDWSMTTPSTVTYTLTGNVRGAFTAMTSAAAQATKEFERISAILESDQMRELRLIADVERLKAQLWWERFKANGCVS